MAISSQTNNLTLGKGEVYFAPFKSGTKTPEGFRYLGNTPAFSIKIDVKTLDHYDSDHGLKQKDEQVILETNRSSSITTDNLNAANVAMFFLGSSSTTATVASTGHTETVTDLEFDRVYMLGLASFSTGARGVENVTATKGATALVADTDFVVDAERGTIEFLSGTLTAGDDVTVEYDIAASTAALVVSGSNTAEGAILFKATNPVGDKVDYLMPWVKVSPDGEFDLKSDSWTEMKFAVEVLKRTDREAIYGNGQPVYA